MFTPTNGFVYDPTHVGIPLARLHNDTLMDESSYDIAIIGGGPAGSTAAILFARAGFRICLIEKKIFPREIVCGEFLSREVLYMLDELELTKQFQLLLPNPLTTFRYCPEYARSFSSELRFIAYGLKRGKFDSFLLDKARESGATIYQPAAVEKIHRTSERYDLMLKVEGGKEHITARQVIGAYGKNSSMDKILQRDFRERKSRLNGIKFHIPKKYFRNIPEHEIQIYTSRNMYCGVNVVNDSTATVSFLERRSPTDMPPRSRIVELAETNPHFAEILSPDFEESIESFPIYGAGDIYFGKKNIVENGIFLIGDAARVIAPLAGDGISMAMQSANVIFSVFKEGRRNALDDDALTVLYRARWKSNFQRRVRIAKGIQQILLSCVGKKVSELILAGFPSLLSHTIEYTRG